MSFHRKKLAVAMGCSVLVSSIGNPANAFLFLGETDLIPPDEFDEFLTYSASLNVDAETGLDIANEGTTLAILGIASPNPIPPDTDFRLTVTLSNEATFIEEPFGGVFDEFVDPEQLPILSGGVASNSVVFFGDSGEEGIGILEEIGSLFIIGMESINLVNRNDVEVSVDFQIADDFGVTDISSYDSPFITFAESFSVSAELESAGEATIDVGTN